MRSFQLSSIEVFGLIRPGPLSNLMKSTGGIGDPAWRLPAWIGLVLVGVTIIAYLPTKDHDFVAYDDPVYVSENAIVQRGLTVGGGKTSRPNYPGTAQPCKVPGGSPCQKVRPHVRIG